MLWYILYLPNAEPLEGTGSLSAGDGFYEHFYTNIALFSAKEQAERIDLYVFIYLFIYLNIF